MKELPPCGREEANVPLVCDLDCTLCRTDTLHELLLRALSSAPGVFLRSLWLLLTRGRLSFKLYLAERVSLNEALLPYNTAVITLLRAARTAGRRTVLATASAQTLAEAIAAHLGLFDAVYGSTSQQNLKGSAKAGVLLSLYGESGFDYIGDSKADRPLFAVARQSYLADPRLNNLKPLRSFKYKNTTNQIVTPPHRMI